MKAKVSVKPSKTASNGNSMSYAYKVSFTKKDASRSQGIAYKGKIKLKMQ